MPYTIKEAEEASGVSAYRIRYYDGKGLIPNLQRDKNNNRIFDDASLDIIRLINCFRLTDMPLKQIQQYISLLNQGADGKAGRLAIMNEHQSDLQDQADLLATNLAIVQQKIVDLNNNQYD